MTTDATTIAAESGHWYAKDGTPMYEVPNASKPGQMRATTVKDAKKLDLVPSVTSITKIMAAPGLENWKTEQVLISAYTLPQTVMEHYEDWSKRVRAEAKLKAAAAAERGTKLHAEIEASLSERNVPRESRDLINKVYAAVNEHDIILGNGKPERSFAHPLGYGGKVDWHNDAAVVDFKSKDSLTKNGKVMTAADLVFDEHHMQLAAYSHGLGLHSPRCLNVFVGIDDCKVVVCEHAPEDIERGWQMFLACLALWKHKNGVA